MSYLKKYQVSLEDTPNFKFRVWILYNKSTLQFSYEFFADLFQSLKLNASIKLVGPRQRFEFDYNMKFSLLDVIPIDVMNIYSMPLTIFETWYSINRSFLWRIFSHIMWNYSGYYCTVWLLGYLVVTKQKKSNWAFQFNFTHPYFFFLKKMTHPQLLALFILFSL